MLMKKANTTLYAGLLILACIANADAQTRHVTGESVRHKFNAIAAQWLEECSDCLVSSDRTEPVRRPAFEKLVELGPAVAPLVVERIRKSESRREDGKQSVEFETEDLPWALVLQEIMRWDIQSNPKYRSKVRRYYEKSDMSGIAQVIDPAFSAYIPEVANRFVVERWMESQRPECGPQH